MDNMIHILCYGDSNTFGSNPGGQPFRHPIGTRWTGRLQQMLGEGYRIIEEGLGGRTTVWDDPLEPGRNGLTFLPVALLSHRPIDLVILFLGTNDCKSFYNAQPPVIARGAERLIETIRRFDYGAGIEAPKILLVSPIHIGREVTQGNFISFDAGSAERSRQLAPYFERSAKKYGCAFLDAAKVAGPGPDQLHMDAAGHEELAKVLYRMIKNMEF